SSLRLTRIVRWSPGGERKAAQQGIRSGHGHARRLVRNTRGRANGKSLNCSARDSIPGFPGAPPVHPTTPGPTPPENAPTTSCTLLQRARGHEPDAWTRIVGLYGPLVRTWARRAGLGAEDADDVAQEVFASAAAHLADFRRDRAGDTFRGWLRVITRN